MDKVELLIGIAEIAVALAGFTGVVVAFGSRSQGSWNPGDRLRLAFLLEASLTAAGFSLLALLGLVGFSSIVYTSPSWPFIGAWLWAALFLPPDTEEWKGCYKIRAGVDPSDGAAVLSLGAGRASGPSAGQGPRPQN